MIETLKKTLLAGVGAAVLTKEKIQESLDDFVAQGRISAKDARAMADRIARRGRKEFVSASGRTGARLKELIAKADRQSQTRIDQLLARIEKLEKQAKPATRKRRPRAKATARK